MNEQKSLIAGMDEAGRGPVIGPLVFGLVVVTSEQESFLKENGVEDSKTLSKLNRQRLAAIIKENTTYCDTLVVNAETITSLMGEMTLNEIEIKFFRQLISPQVNKIGILQLDAADVNAERFGSRFADLFDGQIQSFHKGDQLFTSVGAASILAKTTRDEIIESLQQKISKFDPTLPSFGSGYPTDAKPFLQAYYSKYHSFPMFVRTTWKTVKKIESSFAQSDLNSFFS
ncbi:MAG: ribonuclease HII [Candidatus Heimdallarchaeota archaeon]|nr:ribonuclease HII [Candidatus Heimdallarchaeota archaeon]MDH5645034.1 ribonuclease HII [Candidatus Heimdallarchaeota archaeon]